MKLTLKNIFNTILASTKKLSIMMYTNLELIRTPQGVEVEGNSLWKFNQHLNLMVLIANESIKIKPSMSFQRFRKN